MLLSWVRSALHCARDSHGCQVVFHRDLVWFNLAALRRTPSPGVPSLPSFPPHTVTLPCGGLLAYTNHHGTAATRRVWCLRRLGPLRLSASSAAAFLRASAAAACAAAFLRASAAPQLPPLLSCGLRPPQPPPRPFCGLRPPQPPPRPSCALRPPQPPPRPSCALRPPQPPPRLSAGFGRRNFRLGFLRASAAAASTASAFALCPAASEALGAGFEIGLFRFR